MRPAEAFIVLAMLSTAAPGTAKASLGDLAPIGAVDNCLDGSDLLLLRKLIVHSLSPDAAQLEAADIAPLGNPDGVIDGSDLFLLRKAIVKTADMGTPPCSVLCLGTSGIEYEVDETSCDDIDNDCDGTTDEDCSQSCVPACAGKTCGDDGCLGSCGTCGPTAQCDGSGACVPTCSGNCAGKKCGDDGCGNSCGNCGQSETCSSLGNCEPLCTPTCTNKNCGTDGCGGTCGDCTGGSTCDPSGLCIPECIPTVNFQTKPVTALLTGVQLGTGIDTLNMEKRGNCLQNVTQAVDCGTSKGKRSFKLHVAKSHSELKSSLGLAADASYNGGLWGVNASASYFASSSVTSDSLFVIVEVDVEFEQVSVANPMLSDNSLSKIQSGWPQFLGKCGDQYVSTVTTGGRFRAIFRFSQLTNADKSEISSNLSAFGGTWDASVSFSSTMQELSNKYEVDLQVIQEGGSLAAVPTDPSALIEFAQCFGADPTLSPECQPILTCQNAAVTSIVTSTYYTSENWPDDKLYPNTLKASKRIDELAASYDEVKVALNDIANRLSKPGNLSSTGCESELQKYTTKKKELGDFLATVQETVEFCREVGLCGPPEQCFAKLVIPETQLPKLDPSKKDTCGPACTDGVGSTFEFDDYGYCTRCTWTGLYATNYENAATGILNRQCKYMRRGADTIVRVAGSVFQKGDPAVIGWIEFYVQGSSGGDGPGACTQGQPCYFSDKNAHKSKTKLPFLLEVGIPVSKKSGTSSIDAFINQNMCQGSLGNGCDYQDVTVDVCDTDKQGGCGYK